MVSNVKDPRAMPDGAQDAVNFRTLLSRSGIQFAGRISNLPSPSNPDLSKQPIAGQPYLIKFDLAGQTLDRLAIWDGNAITIGPIAEVQVEAPTADAALITAHATSVDIGKTYTAGKGTGALLDITANIDGTISAVPTTGGKDYAIGDSFEYAAGSLSWGAAMTGATKVTVTRLGGPAPLGGWRFINIHEWVKTTKAAPDHQYGMEKGDLQTTVELNHEELKVWTGTAWSTIVSTDDIKGWIAALSLFEGTVKQIGGADVPGAVELYALPDLESTNPADVAAAAGKTSHYWTWVGEAGYVISAALANGIGRDLANAIMQVGDWLQIANRGTAAAPDLRWVHIGGDLLAKSRADVLYGINAWKAGNYEKGSLVNHKGALYRATGNVTPTDSEPGTVTSAGTPAGPGGVPPAVPPTVAAPWEVIPLTAGVHSVPADANLPNTAPASDVYLVLSSATAGGKPALYSYDLGTSTWIELGGGGGLPMKLDGGIEMRSIGVPVGCLMMWMLDAPPAGWLFADGSTFTAVQYPELAVLFPTLTLPDMRGAYARGAGQNTTNNWGDVANKVGMTLEDSTALPKTRFRTGLEGAHAHTYQRSVTVINAGINAYQATDNDGGEAATRTSNEGAHYHYVYDGGDPETRPKTILVNWIIKCTDRTVSLIS